MVDVGIISRKIRNGGRKRATWLTEDECELAQDSIPIEIRKQEEK